MEEDRKIFVGGLPQDVKPLDVREYFSQYGAVQNVDLKTDHSTGRAKGFGFVSFKDSESAESALAEENHKILNCDIGCKKAKAKQGKIYLGNLPSEGISNEDLKAHFVTFGPVAEVVRPVDKAKNNEPRNFAFITFEREETAKQMIEEGTVTINSHVLNVRRVKVKVKETTSGGKGESGDVRTDIKPEVARGTSSGGQRRGKREIDRKSGNVRTDIKPKAKGASSKGHMSGDTRRRGRSRDR